ncbi:hypothetical protein TanjilG_09501 [Lupinus angustifolius]|uniref:KIB1-4 beta-propeller domain-containing protein n=1 Tax=Lupinus angustifolius TaxID=3871 RepID=A0A4P1RWB4_LUPAN|nr:PREDICTED: uncharacterized protein LOC109358275 [Lupinus angustifolius]OIW19481.1 hypothetical protein TanjilG_09501 [Lupinus angustifolius]
MACLSVPYAILPSLQQKDDDDLDDDNISTINRSIFSLLDNKRYEQKNMFKNLGGAWCVGSSYGWIVLLDKYAKPIILNPFSGMQIQFPSFPSVFIHPVSETYFIDILRKSFVVKAVLNHSPSLDDKNYILAIMYGCHCKIAFCCNSFKWVELSDAKYSYCDIVFNNNYLYALAQDGSIEVWDVCEQNPRKILHVKPTMEIDEQEEKEFPRDLFSNQLYMVLSGREILLVKRYIGNFVNGDGEIVCEGDLLSDEDTQPLICPYRTKHFSVYVLVNRTKWEKVTSLQDRVLFVGANESTSMWVQALPGREGNTIYFSDDRWEEMNMDYSYGGQDWGIFSLQDGSIKLHLPYTNVIKPPPIWVVPTP